MRGRFLVTGAVTFAVVGLMVFFFGYAKIKTKRETCEGPLPSINDVSSESWENLSQKRIFFGHQSVGEDIINGVEDILKENNKLELNIVKGKEISSISGEGFIHSKIGRNTRPVSKFRAFRKTLAHGAENQVDIALMKLCYVDLKTDSETQRVFEEYRTNIASLETEFPGTVFVHMTVPIESPRKGTKGLLKEVIKRMIRRPGVTENNRVRETYNDLLRSTYSGSEPIFDIALIESIGPDGMRSYRGSGSAEVIMMDSRYTHDGGHLNQMGKKHVAEQFLIMLAEVADSERN